MKDAKADKAVIALKSFETLSKVADGKSTKIIVPSDLQAVATMGTTLKEVFKEDKENWLTVFFFIYVKLNVFLCF